MNDDDKTRMVRSILNTEWNPIGLSLSEDDDEYNAYVKNIISRKWSEKELSGYLTKAITQNIGLEMNEERQRKTIDAIKSILTVLNS